MNQEAAVPARPPRGIKTYQDLLRLPEDPRHRYELLEGELYVTASPIPDHQWVSLELERILDHHVRNGGLGRIYHAPVDLVFEERNVVVPDIIFISRRRLRIVGRKNIGAAPELVIEILSPSTSSRDQVLKRRIYERFGVKHYWIVDPADRTLQEFILKRGAYRAGAVCRGNETFRPVLFPGLAIELPSIWPPEPPRRSKA